MNEHKGESESLELIKYMLCFHRGENLELITIIPLQCEV